MLFSEMGMTLTTAVNVFIRQAVQEQAIPFRIYIDSDKVAASKAKEAMRAMQNQAVVNGNEHMSMDEIDAIISKTRQEKRRRQNV